jgi:hypothetical protein
VSKLRDLGQVARSPKFGGGTAWYSKKRRYHKVAIKSFYRALKNLTDLLKNLIASARK